MVDSISRVKNSNFRVADDLKPLETCVLGHPVCVYWGVINLVGKSYPVGNLYDALTYTQRMVYLPTFGSSLW